MIIIDILIGILIAIIIIFFLNKINNIKENFNDSKKDLLSLFDDLMKNHYNKIFPNNQNRNSAGFRFFQYIYDNLATTPELFDKYNQFYCAVSGSIISPDRSNNYSIIKVKQQNNQCKIGKYYQCCFPCKCDIMKYVTVVPTKIELPKGSNNFITRDLLTINDPCINIDNLPKELDKNVFKCNNDKLLENAYHVDKKNQLTKKSGKLVIGVLYSIDQSQNKLVDQSVKDCSDRINTPVDKLENGMGDIFVKLALMNNSTQYTNTENDYCK